MSSVSEMLFCHAYALRVQHIYQLKSRNVFLTVGDDEDFCPLIRVWNLDKVKNTCTSTVSITWCTCKY